MKKELRKQYKALRDSISKENRALWSAEICRKITELDAYKTAKTLLLYAKTGSEIDLLPLFEKAQKDGIACAFPRCISDGIMEFYYVNSLSELQKGAYGIMEPTAECPVTDFRGTIAIVPALAYDKDGYRLGYGGGYYDRFLAAHPVFAVGIAYSACTTHCLPHGEFDKAVETVITEKEIFCIIKNKPHRISF